MLTAQRVLVQVAHVDAVDGDAPAGHVVEARDQVDQARLARAGRAQDGHRLARLGHEVDGLEHRVLVVAVVAEAHLLEGDAAVRREASAARRRDPATCGSLSSTSSMRSADASAREMRMTSMLTIISDMSVCVR